MEPVREEKTQRLHVALEEALKPLLEKLEKLEQDMNVIKKEQEEIKKILLEKAHQ